MATAILDFLNNNRFLLLVIVVGGLFIASQIVKAIRDAAAARAFEESRREIAAYVAEGSISAEQAALLLAVKRKGNSATVSSICASLDDDEEGSADPDKRLAKAISESDVDEDVGRELVNRRASLTPHQWTHAVELVITGMGVDEAVALARLKPGPNHAAPSPTPASIRTPAHA